MDTDLKILETGDIYFYVRPFINREVVKDQSDAEQFFFILKDRERPHYRVLTIPSEHMPSSTDKEERSLATYVERVSSDFGPIELVINGEHFTPKDAKPHLLAQAKQLADGKYCLLFHNEVIHFAYLLEHPLHYKEFQFAFDLANYNHYLLAIENPLSPRLRTTIVPSKKAHFPKPLQALFGNIPLMPMSELTFLNYEGAELLLIEEKAIPDEKVLKHLPFRLKEHFATFPRQKVHRVLEQEKSLSPPTPLVEERLVG